MIASLCTYVHVLMCMCWGVLDIGWCLHNWYSLGLVGTNRIIGTGCGVVGIGCSVYGIGSQLG